MGSPFSRFQSERLPEQMLCVNPQPDGVQILALDFPPAASQFPKPEPRFRVLGSERPVAKKFFY